jgi:hypothetical protein
VIGDRLDSCKIANPRVDRQSGDWPFWLEGRTLSCQVRQDWRGVPCVPLPLPSTVSSERVRSPNTRCHIRLRPRIRTMTAKPITQSTLDPWFPRRRIQRPWIPVSRSSMRRSGLTESESRPPMQRSRLTQSYWSAEKRLRRYCQPASDLLIIFWPTDNSASGESGPGR